MLAVNTDAHSTQELAHQLAGGLATARRAWATPKNILNCQTPAQVRKFVARKRP